MKRLIGITLLLAWLPGCAIPIAGAAVYGAYRYKKGQDQDAAQHKEKMELEQARLETLNKQLELEQVRAGKK